MTPVSRRDFLAASATAAVGLSVGVTFGACGGDPPLPAPDAPFAPDAWLRIDTAGHVTVVVDRAEMGQGISTGLAMIVAEELDARWEMMRVVFAPAHPDYGNALLRGMQATGSSTSIRAAWVPLREAAAKARLMLVRAAAAEWGVPEHECQTVDGRVDHASTSRSRSYGELATAAGALRVPSRATLKELSSFRLIGRRLPRLDSPDVVRGAPIYSSDLRLPGMLTAVIARPPVVGASVTQVDDAAALRVPGVRQVRTISSGVAVVADGYWAAEQGRQALRVTWSAGSAPALDDAAVDAALRGALGSATLPVIRADGAAHDVLAASDRRLETEYALPYLAHATMEPMVCVADVRDGACTVWAPTQLQWAPALFGGGAVGVAAERAGVPVGRVTIHSMQMGGGFGRRSELDFVGEAVELSRAIAAPVKVQWSREDDMRHDWYRPAARHRLRGGLGADGRPVAWTHDIASPSLLKRFLPGFIPGFVANRVGLLVNGADPTTIEGADDLPYAIGARELRCIAVDLPVPVGFWRSVGHSHTAFAVESFIDELAHLAGVDPYRYRRSLLADRPRHLEVLEFAANRSGWGTPLPEGRARGIALHESFGSIVAQVAEVSRDSDGRPRVHRVVCAINCGLAINPEQVAAQMEGGIVFGLSAALYGNVRIAGGGVVTSNFHDYPLLRADRMPLIQTHIVPTADPPMGVGETATPPIAPAVANAFFALTGHRVRQLPFPVQ